MKRRFNFLGLFFALFAILSFAFMYCSDYKDETYTISKNDGSACESFTAAFRIDTIVDTTEATTTYDTVYLVDTLVSFTLNELDETWNEDTVSTDSSIITADFDKLIARLVEKDTSFVQDTASSYKSRSSFEVNMKSALLKLSDAEDDTSYVIFDNSSNSNESDVILYFADYVEINLWSSAGKVMPYEKEQLDPETIAYCDFIKTKLSFNVEPKRYILQIIRHDKTLSNIFLMVCLNKNN